MRSLLDGRRGSRARCSRAPPRPPPRTHSLPIASRTELRLPRFASLTVASRRGDSSDDNSIKLYWYSRGKDLADAAVREDEGNADAHFALFANWGRWLQTDGWLKNAYHLPALRRELDRALEIDPNHPDALAAMGGLYVELPRFLGGDVAKAEPLLVRAIELDPLAVGARLELADRYMQMRQDGARDLATTARRLAVEQGKPHFVRRADALLAEIGPAPEQTQARQ